MKEEAADTDNSDSNKLDDIIDTSLTVKSEVGEDDEEKKDNEKDVEGNDVDLLQNDGDIKLEDLEEQNDVSFSEKKKFHLVQVNLQEMRDQMVGQDWAELWWINTQNEY